MALTVTLVPYIYVYKLMVTHIQDMCRYICIFNMHCIYVCMYVCTSVQFALLNFINAVGSNVHSRLSLLPHMQNVPASLFDMPALQMLDLSRNHIIELPHAVGQCGSLRVLCLRDNELTAVPEELGSLKELQVLDLSGNR